MSFITHGFILRLFAFGRLSGNIELFLNLLNPFLLTFLIPCGPYLVGLGNNNSDGLAARYLGDLILGWQL
jgi:hypothetical protein